MTSPSAPIDADLSPFSNDVYYVLEDGGIWKTENLTSAGAATWEEVWSSSDFEGAEFGGLLRIRCAYREGLVYVLGWGAEDVEYKPFVLRSENAGTTWSQNWIEEEVEVKDYTVTYRVGEGICESTNGNSSWEHFDADPLIFERIGDDEVDANPIAWAYRACGGYLNGTNWENSIVLDCDEADDIVDNACGSTGWAGSDFRTGVPTAHGNSLYGSHPDCYPPLDDYFGVRGVDYYYNSGHYSPCPKEDNRIKARWTMAARVDSPAKYSYSYEFWVFWNKPSPAMPKALDCARSNPDWVYVGLLDKVMKSEDGGHTWEEWIDEHGAYDICVDPQAAGAIYYWDTNGALRLNVAGVDQGSLLSDSAYNQHGRLARDLNSGRLWAIDSSGNIKLRYNGAWGEEAQYEGNMPMGIKAYLGGTLIVLDSDEILVSADYGETWEEKTGDWSGYGSPKAGHLMSGE